MEGYGLSSFINYEWVGYIFRSCDTNGFISCLTVSDIHMLVILKRVFYFKFKQVSKADFSDFSIN